MKMENPHVDTRKSDKSYHLFSAEPKHLLNIQPNSRIVDVTAARVTSTDISFRVKCLGRCAFHHFIEFYFILECFKVIIFIQTFFRLTSFLSIPTSACTIVSDPSCTQVRNIMCDDVPPTSQCEVYLRRRFLEPGTYCVNITLEDSSSLALASTTVTINKSQDAPGELHKHNRTF